MRWRGSNILTIVFLVMWLGIVATWILSYWYGLSLMYAVQEIGPVKTSSVRYQIIIEHGGIAFVREWRWYDEKYLRALVRSGGDLASGRTIRFGRHASGRYPLAGRGMPTLRRWDLFGFSFLVNDDVSRGRGISHYSYWVRSYRAAAAPHWFLAILTGIVPVRTFLKLRRQRRAAHRVRAGLCMKCGYDLRASKDRCPECGMPCSGGPSPAGEAGGFDQSSSNLPARGRGPQALIRRAEPLLRGNDPAGTGLEALRRVLFR